MSEEKSGKSATSTEKSYFSASVIPYRWNEQTGTWQLLLVRKAVISYRQVYNHILIGRPRVTSDAGGIDQLLRRIFHHNGGGKLVPAGGRTDDGKKNEVTNPKIAAAREFREEVLDLLKINKKVINKSAKDEFVRVIPDYFVFLSEQLGDQPRDQKEEQFTIVFGLNLDELKKDLRCNRAIMSIIDSLVSDENIDEANSCCKVYSSNSLKSLEEFALLEKRDFFSEVSKLERKHVPELHEIEWINIEEVEALLEEDLNTSGKLIEMENKLWIHYLWPYYDRYYRNLLRGSFNITTEKKLHETINDIMNPRKYKDVHIREAINKLCETLKPKTDQKEFSATTTSATCTTSSSSNSNESAQPYEHSPSSTGTPSPFPIAATSDSSVGISLSKQGVFATRETASSIASSSSTETQTTSSSHPISHGELRSSEGEEPSIGLR